MTHARLGPGAERRHPPGPEPDWVESWYFDFAAVDASLAGYAQLVLVPHARTAAYWAAVVGDGRPLLTLRESEASLPRPPGLELRAQGLWADHVCETPNDHWTVGLEAFAVALDDPDEAVRGERGDLVALGFDLEWEAEKEPEAAPDGYRQACTVYGEVLIGTERLPVQAPGHRRHQWGPPRWPSRLAGRLADGTWFAADDVPPPPASVTLGPLCLDVEVQHRAPVLLSGIGSAPTPFPHALCTVRGADGRTGVAWAEWLSSSDAPAGGSA